MIELIALIVVGGFLACFMYGVYLMAFPDVMADDLRIFKREDGTYQVKERCVDESIGINMGTDYRIFFKSLAKESGIDGTASTLEEARKKKRAYAKWQKQRR